MPNPYAAKYPFKATVFCSSREVEDTAALEDARIIARYMGEESVGLVCGESAKGFAGTMVGEAHAHGAEVYSIGLNRHEAAPHKAVSFFEGYDFLWEKQRRLIELGDAYIALPGGLETLAEVIDVHIVQQFGEVTHPLILVGDYAENYRTITDFISRHKLMYNLPDRLIFAKNGHEAVEHLRAHFKKLRSEEYINKTYYPALPPEGIFEHVKQNQNRFKVLFEGLLMNVLPNVYPSNRFRSSRALAAIVAKLARGKRIADMACGPGVMGLVAAANDASHVVQVDINPAAIENARLNAKELGLNDKMDIYEGDMFEPLAYRYQRYFDLIFFNPPFHRDTGAYKNDKLMYAFYGHGNAGGAIDLFLMRAKEHLAPGGEIVIVFSNKDQESMRFMEESFGRYGYTYDLKIYNEDTGADTRLYTVRVQKEVVSPKEALPTFRLGAILAETGFAHNDGIMMRRGIDLAIGELKKRGVSIEFGTGDDQSSERGAAIAAADMLQKFSPHAIIGPTWSIFIDAALPILNEAGITYFTPATSSDLLGAASPGRLSGSGNDSEKSAAITNFLKEREARRLTYIRRDNRWGLLHAHLCQDIATQFGMAYTELLVSPTPKKQEVTKLVDELIRSKADVVLIDNYDDFFYEFCVQLKKKRSGVAILCTTSISDSLRVELRKLDLLSPMYLIDAAVPDSYKEKYYYAYGDASLHRYSFNAYAGVHILAQAFHGKKPEDELRAHALQMRATVEGQVFSYKPNGDLIGSQWVIEQIPL